MFDLIAMQGSISARHLGISVLVMALCAIGYSYARQVRPSATRREWVVGRVTIEAENKLHLDAQAQQLLGIRSAELTSLASLSQLVTEVPLGTATANCAVPFEASLAALVRTGAGFETLLQNEAGEMVVAHGQPSGRRVIVRIRAATGQETKLAAEVAARAATDEQVKLLRAASDGSAEITVCLGEAGALRWQSAAFKTLPAETQETIHHYAWSACHDPDAAANDQVVVRRPNEPSRHLALQTRQHGDDLIICTATDITRQVEAESAFRRFVGTMSDTFAHLKISLMIFDAKRRLTLFNPATVDMIHMDVTWLAQRPTLKALIDRLREARMTPDQPDFIKWRDALLKATAPKDDTGGDRADTRQEDVWHLASGRTLKVLARPHPSGGLAVIIEDITDAMALKRQSVSERAVHIATADVLKEALVLFSPDGAARLSNTAFRSLWSLDADKDVTGRHVTDIVNHCRACAPDDVFWDDLVDCVTGTHRRTSVTAKLTHVRGTTMMARISPVPDGSVLAVFADITDSERIAAALTDRNSALEQAQEMRIALIDQISHQLRNPLNSIVGFSQMLTKGHCGTLNEQQANYVNGIATAADELLGAINGMTNIIDLDEDPNTTTGAVSSADQILTDVASIMNSRAGAEIVRLIPPEPPLTPSPKAPTHQRVHLRQIIFNMITDTLIDPAKQGIQLDTKSQGAEVSMGVDGDLLVIMCRCQCLSLRVPPTLAFAMASRLARTLNGTISLDETLGWRTLHCRLPLDVVHGPRVLSAPHADHAAIAPPAW